MGLTVEHELTIVLANLSRQVGGIVFRSKGGMLAAGHIIMRRSKELTPHKSGHLKGFTDVIAFGSGLKAAVVLSYNAGYAIYVHEINKNYKKGQWKFLETAVREKSDEALFAIRERAKVR